MTRYNAGKIITIDAALRMYKRSIAVIINDGKYVEIEKDLSASTEKVNS